MNWKLFSGIAAAIIFLMVAAVYVILLNYNYNSLKPEITRAVKDNTGREITLGGDICLKIGFAPSLVVKNVSFQNAPWGSQPDLAKIKRFEIKVKLFPLLFHRIEIKQLILVEPEILLETDNSGRSNLVFKTTQKKDHKKEKETSSHSDWKLPALTFDKLRIEKGRLTRINHETKKTYAVNVDILTATAASSTSPIKLKLEGTYDETSFEATGDLCPLAAFINPTEPWPVNLAIKTGAAAVTLNGKIIDPLAWRGIKLNFTVKGKNLANFKQLSGDPLNLSGPFEISGQITDVSRNVYSVSNLKILQGENDIGGSVELNLAQGRPKLTAVLSAQKIDLKTFFQTASSVEKTAKKSNKKAVTKRIDKIFSGDPLPLNTLGYADADVKIKAVQVMLPNRPLNDLDMGLALKDGTLTVKPLKAVLGKGFMDGQFSLQTQGNTASIAMVVKINKADIGYFTKDAAGSEGNLDIDIDLKTRGASIAGLMGGLNGNTFLLMGRGRVDNKFISIPGGNLSSSIFSLINPLQRGTQHTSINCFVSGFNIKDGIANTTSLVLNTDNMVVVGEGEINLKTERLNLSLKPVLKTGITSGIAGKLTGNLSELTKPFKLGGTLAHPSLAVDPTQTAITVGKVFGGLTLFGPAGIAAALIGSNTDDENSCTAAISAAKKGVRTKKASSDNQKPGSAEKILKDAGGELKKFFGR